MRNPGGPKFKTCPSNARGQGFIRGGGTGFYMLHCNVQKKKKKAEMITDINSTQSIIWSNETMLNLANPYKSGCP